MFTLAQCNAHGQKWCPRCQKNQNSKIEKLYRVVQTEKKAIVKIDTSKRFCTTGDS